MLASVNLRGLTWLLLPKNPAVFGLAREMIMFVVTSPPAKVTVYRGRMKYVILVYTLQRADNLDVP